MYSGSRRFAQTKDLAAAGQSRFPLLESLFGPDDPQIRRLAGYVGFGEVREHSPSVGRARLMATIDRERMVGGADDDTHILLWRFYGAEASLYLGRPGEALAEIDALLPLDEAVRGARDPGTLNTRHMRARALLDLGRATEAVADFGLVVMGYKAAKGENHWWVSAARSDEIGSRMALGERGFAAELERIANPIGRERYPHTDSVLRTRYRIVRDLIDTGETDKARAKAAIVSALCSDPAVPRHRYVMPRST